MTDCITIPAYIWFSTGLVISLFLMGIPMYIVPKYWIAGTNTYTFAKSWLAAEITTLTLCVMLVGGFFGTAICVAELIVRSNAWIEFVAWFYAVLSMIPCIKLV